MTTRTFRLFVSSTFDDLKAERNALQNKVFPKLSSLCAEKGARFQAIDLRWGVREEAGLDHKTMEICLAEIASCRKTGIRPNFIVLLGERYGWRPAPARIGQNEFESLLDHVMADERRLLFYDERQTAADQGWFRLDRNAEPPEYVLLPREGAYEDPAVWEPVEARIREALERAALALPLLEESRVKYNASATHQEILAGLGADRRDNEHVFVFVKNPAAPKDPALVSLIETLRRAIPEANLIPFTDPAMLCQQAKHRLWNAMESEISRFGAQSALSQEQEAHRTFARDRSRRFVGRADELRAIKGYINGSEARPLVLVGPSGSGKSAILATASEDHPGIRRFIGATPASSTTVTLLQSLCEEVDDLYGREEELPTSFQELAVALKNRLRVATADRPLTLYLDGLDQLAAAGEVHRLFRDLPPHCRIVLSTTDVPFALAGSVLVPIGTFSADDASAALGLWLGDAHRTLHHGQHERLLASFRKSGLPLYLRLAFEEARLWRSFDPAEECVLGDGLDGMIDQLVGRLSARANHGPVLVNRTLGYLAAARYGLTEDEMLDLLAANDDVWSDFEGSMKHDLPESMRSAAENKQRRLPVIIWARLYQDLGPYLTERAVPGGTAIGFYHRQLAVAVARDIRQHADLAAYFERRPHWIGRGLLPLSPGTPDARKASELPWQLNQSGETVRLAGLLGDVAFLEAKVSAGLSADLLEDFGRLEMLCSDQRDSPLFRETLLVWRVLANVLDRVMVDPASIAIQIGLELQNIGAAAAPEPREAGWMRRLDLATDDRPCLSRFRGARGVPYFAQTATRETFVHGIRFSPDGGKLLFADGEGGIVQWRWSAPTVELARAPVAGVFRRAALLSDGAIALGGPHEVWTYSAACLWDARFHEGVWQQTVTAAAGTRLGAIAWSPAGVLLAGQSGAGLARIKRFRGSESLKPLRMPYSDGDPDLTCLAVSADGQIVAAGFGDGTLAISTGFRSVVHRGSARACAFLDGGARLASVGADGCLAIRDPVGRLLREFHLYHGDAACLAYNARHKNFAIGHQDGYVSLVSVEESTVATTPGFWPGVRGAVASLDYSACGRYLAAGGSEGVARVFEVGATQQATKKTLVVVERGVPAGPVREVTFAGARDDLVFIDQQQQVRTTSPRADSRYLPFRAHCFGFDPARDRIVAARGGEVYFLEPETGKPDAPAESQGSTPRGLAVSEDGRWLALREDTRLLIYEKPDGQTVLARRVDLFLTPFLPSEARQLSRASMRFCRRGTLLACPLEPIGVPGQNTLLFIETATGHVAGRLEYTGSCAALEELGEEDILIVGLGRGADAASGTVARAGQRDALLFCSIGTGERLQSRPLVPEDLGVTAIAAARETMLKGIVVAVFESGRIRITSLQSELWAASVCLPDPMVAVRFRGAVIQVADNGASQGNWPQVHDFTMYFPVASDRRISR